MEKEEGKEERNRIFHFPRKQGSRDKKTEKGWL